MSRKRNIKLGLTHHFVIDVPVPIQESELVCIGVLGVSILSLSTFWVFEMFPPVWYFLFNIRILDFDWLIAGVFSCIFIFIAAGVFACGLNFFSLCAVVFAKTCFTFLPSRASNRQIHSEYFFFAFMRKVT
jgi:hypothetical protein